MTEIEKFGNGNGNNGANVILSYAH